MEGGHSMEILLQILLQTGLMVAGFVLLIKGADWFVDGAAGIATRLGIPQLIIGLTIVAMGTSMPEAAVSISSALKGSADITIGNVVGSNILNILVILGLTAAVTSISVAKSTVRYEIPYMILVTIVLLLLGFTENAVNFGEGIFLWGFFIAYLVYLFLMAKKQAEPEPEQRKTEDKPVWKLIGMILVGVVMVVVGSDLSVDGASAIARVLGISERFIGLTIVALGTSLPELVTSVSAARKGNTDIAIGNVVGSNIFNILFVVGTAALITPVAYAENFVIDTVIAIAAGVLLLLGVVKRHQLSRKFGFAMLAGYCAYFVSLI